MEWFKHSTRSHDDPDISDAIDEFGHPGYSIFFIVLEIYGDEYNHLDSEGWLRLSKRFVTRKLRLSSTKVEQILNFYSERERILFKKDDKSYFINCPKFIDIASNWTKRKNPSPTEALQSTSVAPTAIEVEEEVDKKKNKKHIYAPDPSFHLFFEEFWKVYPGRNGKKIGKDECRDYCKRFKNGEREQILTGVQNYAMSKQAREGYAKDPIRFLKKQAWLDWQDPERDPNDAYDW